MATIVVVDNRPNDRRKLVALLQNASHQVWEAGDEQEATAVLMGGIPDLMVIDNHRSSIDLVRLVHEMGAWWGTRNIPVVLLTGAVEENKTDCSGVITFFKSSEPELVLRIIDQVLMNRSPQEMHSLGEGSEQ